MGDPACTGRGNAPARPAAVGGREPSVDATARTDPGLGDATLEIEYYTDPLCIWSWAFEPQWRRLRFEFDGAVSWRYRAGGMMPDLHRYSDPIKDAGSPTQMGSYWYRVRDQSGMPIDERIWAEDPPTSSYPASIAVKAAESYGFRIGERYARRLREAVALERRNIARTDVLVALAAEVGIGAEEFRWTLADPAVIEAFRDDVKEARYRDIGRFPALILRSRSGGAALLVGWRPYDALRAAVERAAPGLTPLRRPGCIAQYVHHWGRISTNEVAVAFDMDLAEAHDALAACVEAGVLRRLNLERGELFEACAAVSEFGPSTVPSPVAYRR